MEKSKNVNTSRLYLLLLLVISHLAHSQDEISVAVDDLLNTADTFLAQDQLLTPVDANAHDRYKAVLILDSNNARAQAGLDAIVRRYLELANGAVGRGRFSQAEGFVAKAQTVGGQTGQAQRVLAVIKRKKIAARKSQPTEAASIVAAKPDASKNTQFELDKTALANRDQVMVAQLQSLGLRVKDSREYVLIHARNDAEGRWIYQQMRQASRGYRLRGDIRRSQTPKVILQPPLD